jgi:hypothetical protein
MKLKKHLRAAEEMSTSTGSGMTASANTGQPVGDQKISSANIGASAAATDTGQPDKKLGTGDGVSDAGSQVQS